MSSARAFKERDEMLARGDTDGRQEQLQDAIDEAVEAEQGRWQNAIDELLVKLTGQNGIDGSGCDSGDPLDLTLTEITLYFNAITDDGDVGEITRLKGLLRNVIAGKWSLTELQEAIGDI